MGQGLPAVGALGRWLKKLKELHCYSGCWQPCCHNDVTFVTLVTFHLKS